MKRVLLLGANGQLGQDLQRQLSNDADIHLHSAYRSDLDVERVEEIQPFLQKVDFDYLINCTSYHKTDECEEYPEKAFRVNAIAVREMAKACALKNKAFFHISTDYVFDGSKQTPYVETDSTDPLNVYGNSKVSGENFVRATHGQHFIFRVSSLFGLAGASGKGGNFVETMIRLAKDGKSLNVVNDQVMSPTHTADIAAAIKFFINNEVEEYGTYHCSGEGECSWYDFAVEIFRQLSISADISPVTHTQFPTAAERPAYSVLSNDKLHQFFEMPKWQDSLQQYLGLKGYYSQS